MARANRSEYYANLQLSPRASLPVAQPVRTRRAPMARRKARPVVALRAAAVVAAFVLSGLNFYGI